MSINKYENYKYVGININKTRFISRRYRRYRSLENTKIQQTLLNDHFSNSQNMVLF